MVEVGNYIGSGGYATFTSTWARDSCVSEIWSGRLSELEIKTPGSDVSLPSTFMIDIQTYVTDSCQDTSSRTRRLYAEASTAADLNMAFLVPSSATRIRLSGEASLGCTLVVNDTRCPNVSIVLDVNWSCESPGPVTGRYTADQQYPSSRLLTVSVGTYCPTGFNGVIAFKDGGVVKTTTQSYTTYGYDTRRSSLRYKATKTTGR
ncbi:hypothetical protein HYH02_001859 [Chlamydomonas schloesseri]|uniref:Uncharacterized protein n=1 Tax=Chlamydomonas schloesseri TaxID=2026947 RepID=A0A835WVX4_9CHLO|nr:hypothetical protein HYH02_001859 [Chlamydomonas schloesseri]|eukprot:KAG2453646.1 hypothetical protein HYH02_001859 [Chlamydomonas schloesseri]